MRYYIRGTRVLYLGYDGIISWVRGYCIRGTRVLYLGYEVLYFGYCGIISWVRRYYIVITSTTFLQILVFPFVAVAFVDGHIPFRVG